MVAVHRANRYLYKLARRTALNRKSKDCELKQQVRYANAAYIWPDDDRLILTEVDKTHEQSVKCARQPEQSIDSAPVKRVLRQN